MATVTINFPPLRADGPLTQGDNLHPDSHRTLLELFNGLPLITVSTTGGSANVGIPLAKFNQNVELVYVKISNDANVATLVTSGSDKINSVGAWAAGSLAMGAAQGSKVRIKSDGVVNWYVVG